MFFKSFLIATLFVFYSVNYCEAIKCYVCTSLTNLKCGSGNFEVNESFKRDCDIETRPGSLPPSPEKPKKCSTFVFKDQQGNNITERTCFWETTTNKNDECYKESQQNISECKSCDSDFCNSASKTFGTIGGTFLMVFIIKYILS